MISIYISEIYNTTHKLFSVCMSVVVFGLNCVRVGHNSVHFDKRIYQTRNGMEHIGDVDVYLIKQQFVRRMRISKESSNKLDVYLTSNICSAAFNGLLIQ